MTPATSRRVCASVGDLDPQALIRVLRSLYAHGVLISEMTRNDAVRISARAIQRIEAEKPGTTKKIQELLTNETRTGMISGVGLDNGTLYLEFPGSDRKIYELRAYAELLRGVVDKAAQSSRVNLRRVAPDSESLRATCLMWLNRLGFDSRGHKDLRTILLEPLPVSAPRFRRCVNRDAI